MARERHRCATGAVGRDKNGMDHAPRRHGAAFRYLLGDLMTGNSADQASVLDAVALLADVPAAGLARGQVGTVVESLDEKTALVEFSGDDGHAYAIVPCPHEQLLVLHYVPEAAE